MITQFYIFGVHFFKKKLSEPITSGKIIEMFIATDDIKDFTCKLEIWENLNPQ